MPFLSFFAGKAIMAVAGSAAVLLSLTTCKFHWQKVGRLQERAHVVEQINKENYRINKSLQEANQALTSKQKKRETQLQALTAKNLAMQARINATVAPTGDLKACPADCLLNSE